MLAVKKAFKTNILEDEGDEVDVLVSLKGGKKVFDVDIVVDFFDFGILDSDIVDCYL